jgi:CO dehydrogenase flavoprotein C-terminal domain
VPQFRLRGSVDYPLAGAAVVASLEYDSAIRDAHLAVTAVNPAPRVISGNVEILRGQRLSGELVEQVVERALRVARPLKTSANTPEYRRHMLGYLVKQGLKTAMRTEDYTRIDEAGDVVLPGTIGQLRTDLPRTATGRLQRFKLAQEASES